VGCGAATGAVGSAARAALVSGECGSVLTAGLACSGAGGVDVMAGLPVSGAGGGDDGVALGAAADFAGVCVLDVAVFAAPAGFVPAGLCAGVDAGFVGAAASSGLCAGLDAGFAGAAASSGLCAGVDAGFAGAAASSGLCAGVDAGFAGAATSSAAGLCAAGAASEVVRARSGATGPPNRLDFSAGECVSDFGSAAFAGAAGFGLAALSVRVGIIAAPVAPNAGTGGVRAAGRGGATGFGA
jgi:hypothetical protein